MARWASNWWLCAMRQALPIILNRDLIRRRRFPTHLGSVRYWKYRMRSTPLFQPRGTQMKKILMGAVALMAVSGAS